jgi:putative transposase
LFQNPFKSILCQEDPYLRELVGYIHLNPFTVGLVEDISGLDRYAFSGHSALMGHKDRPWQDTNYILKVVFRGKIDRSQTLLAILLYADGAISNTER